MPARSTGDIDEDGAMGIVDMLLLLANWGTLPLIRPPGSERHT